jgi:catechol 2,3-dioxygenase-like lactoylglutathione lyase family enzyme
VTQASQPSTPIEFFKNFAQIGIVVKDLDQTIRVLTEVFGLGPFRTITYPPPDRPNIMRQYKGKPGNFSYRQAFTSLGAVELELIQPLEGESVWSDFLAEHGQGIHHIRFNIDELPPVVEHLAQNGIEIGQTGAGLRPGSQWAVFDTERLAGFAIEVLKIAPGSDGRVPPIVDGKVQV